MRVKDLPGSKDHETPNGELICQGSSKKRAGVVSGVNKFGGRRLFEPVCCPKKSEAY